MVQGEYTICDEQGHIIFRIYHSIVDPGKRPYRVHCHTAFEIATVMSGKGIYNINGIEYTFKEGDVCIFSCDEVHCITEIFDGKPLDLFNIKFEPRFIWSQNNINNTHLLNIFFNRNDKFCNIFKKSSSVEKIINLIHEIYNEIKNKDEEYEIMIQNMIVTILVTILRNFDYVKKNTNYTHDNTNLRLLEKTMSYINNNIDLSFSLEDLAAMASMSKSQYCTLFKKYNGITPWDYITIKRIEKSIILLKTTKYTKLQIACMCGFNNTANFYRAFKNVTGKIPTDYV